MANRHIRPPVDTQRGPDRERASFERQITEKLDDTDYSIDDLSRVIFFTNKTTQGQQLEIDLENSLRVMFNKLNARNMELERQLEENRRHNATLKANIEELKRRIDQVERLTWL